MAKQNNSLTELQALEGINEHLSTIDNLSEEVGKISTRLSKIEQAHNTTLTTVTAFTKSMTQSFEEMNSLKSKEVPVSLCKTEAVKTIVREQMREALKGIDLKAEVWRKRVSVSEDVLHDTSVCGRSQCVESSAVFDLIYVDPCGKIDVGPFAESEVLTVDNHIYVSFHYYDDQMILWLTWFGICYMVFSLDLAGEDIIVDISYIFNAFLSKKYCWTG